MKTTALRLYSEKDLRLETFDLPPIKEDEILIKIISDSLCMSSYKAAMQGAAHKRVPNDAAVNPIIIGHEFCAEIVTVGAKLTNQYHAGQRVSLQTSLKGTYNAPGYSFRYIGGNSTYGIIPSQYIEAGNLLDYNGDAIFYGSLSEPLSCVIGATHACYHTIQGEYTHAMDIKKGGNIAILAGAGPMGLALIDYLIHRDLRPSLLVVTDIDANRLARASHVLPPQRAEQSATIGEPARTDVNLMYINTADIADPAAHLRELTGGVGYDEVFVFAPVPSVVEQGDAILAYDGCLNFFAGPTNPAFSALFNFYNVHYNTTHVVGTSGGNTDDMREALRLAGQRRINPAVLVTHVGGLDAAKDATLNLPHIPGGKKLIYNHISLPLSAIDDFEKLGETDPLFKRLHELCAEAGGLWNAEAERYLLANAPKLNADKYII
ncbi:MAG: zinc-binding dehydrogenase [Oscillospiraceae bacterium]|jgi:threonine dehydrogenase-like Zn-dependent dehydrogenase|nr:zinc-binding dehydrogenase [Oscillospiraceae bacterium]